MHAAPIWQTRVRFNSGRKDPLVVNRGLMLATFFRVKFRFTFNFFYDSLAQFRAPEVVSARIKCFHDRFDRSLACDMPGNDGILDGTVDSGIHVGSV